MSANDEAKEYLDFYLCSNVETDFAVMLNGPWGAGKTHFIKSYLTERRDRAVPASSLQPSHYLYASLYGVRSVSEITDQFFTQAYPFLNSKGARLAGTVFARLLNGYAGTEVNAEAENKSIIKEFALNFKNRVLVFDDLERCSIPLSDVMGFINAYVEHDGLKVIVIASEEDIKQEEKGSYLRRKEKLVGKTLQIISDPETVLNSFLTKLTNQAVVDTIRREKDSLLRTFNASNKQNFRSLRSVLSDFERVVTASDRRLQDAPQAMAKLLLFMMANELEHRSGELTSQEIANLPETMRWKTIYRATNKEKSPDTIKAEHLEAKYSDVDWKDSVIPPKSLAKLLETGIVDTVSINEHIAKHPLIVGYAETPAWRQLWSWQDLPREQYLKARAQFISELQKHEYTHPGVILHAAGIAISLKEFGDNLLGDEDIATFFERYVDEVRQAGKLAPAREMFGFTAVAFANLGYNSQELPDFRRIYSAVQAATNASFSDRMRVVASTFLDRVTENSNACSSLHEHGVEEGKYGDAPFLHYIDPDNFASVLIKDSCPNSRLLASLVARYGFEANRRVLTDEYPWLKTLRFRLEAIVATAQPPHKHLLSRRIKDYFDEIEKAVGVSIENASAGDEHAGVTSMI